MFKDKTIAIYDIESPWITDAGISALTQIYCIGVVTLLNGNIIDKKMYTEHWTTYSDGSLVECMTALNSADIRVAFNNIGFDDVVMSNVIGVGMPIISSTLDFNSLDLIICAKLCYSKDELMAIDIELNLDKALWGSYSLRAFGARLGNAKMHFDEFDGGLTEDLCTYCIQDCVVTADLFIHLTQKENFPIAAVLTIEHKASTIIQEQTFHGFYIDITKTRALNTKLLKEKLEIATELSKTFMPKWLPDGKVLTYKKKSITRKFLPNNSYIPLLGTKV